MLKSRIPEFLQDIRKGDKFVTKGGIIVRLVHIDDEAFEITLNTLTNSERRPNVAEYKFVYTAFRNGKPMYDNDWDLELVRRYKEEKDVWN